MLNTVKLVLCVGGALRILLSFSHLYPECSRRCSALCFAEGLTAKDLVTGTPAYMAPEMAKAGELDGRADLYAVGCVAYWLLSGKQVFGVRPPMGLLIAHATETPQPIGELVTANLPDRLGDLIMSCLSKKAEDRPPTADFLMKELSCLARAHPWTESDARGWWAAHRPQGAVRVSVPVETEPTAFLRPDSVTRLTLID